MYFFGTRSDNSLLVFQKANKIAPLAFHFSQLRLSNASICNNSYVLSFDFANIFLMNMYWLRTLLIPSAPNSPAARVSWAPCPCNSSTNRVFHFQVSCLLVWLHLGGTFPLAFPLLKYAVQLKSELIHRNHYPICLQFCRISKILQELWAILVKQTLIWKCIYLWQGGQLAPVRKC